MYVSVVNILYPLFDQQYFICLKNNVSCIIILKWFFEAVADNIFQLNNESIFHHYKTVKRSRTYRLLSAFNLFLTQKWFME